MSHAARSRRGHVPVRAIEGESPIKGGGRLIIIDGGFCRAYHRRTGIAGYTLVYNSRGLILRTHQPFESVDKAIHEDEDIASKSEYIYTAPQRILVRDTDEGGRKQALIRDLTAPRTSCLRTTSCWRSTTSTRRPPCIFSSSRSSTLRLPQP